jgi:hypothetical protein
MPEHVRPVSVLIVQELPSYMLTPNLHIVTRHFWQMEEQWGPLSHMGKLFMECSVQKMKSAVAERVSREPEKTMLNGELLCAALDKQPHMGTELFDKLIPAHSAAPLHIHTYDDGNDVGEKLLHRSEKVTGQGMTVDPQQTASEEHAVAYAMA